MEEPFGVLLRRFRVRAGLNHSELAKALGAARMSIRAWEQGQRVPRDRARLEDLAQVLNLSLAEADHLAAAARVHHPTGRGAARVAYTASPADSIIGSIPAGPQRHQLRTPLPDFVGQQQAITTLLAALRQANAGGRVAVISGVRGMGGIGKTELAVLVANHLIDAFPDAQIVVRLRGTSAKPLPPEQALRQVIHAFTPDAKLSNDMDALQSHYQSVLHGQRTLILADDARDAAQVWPLMPPSGCALLITSRQRFSLPGMSTIDLEVLPETEAVSLLCCICSRLDAVQAVQLAHACGSLPLALRISASLLHNDPALSVTDYLQQLADEQQRLIHLRDPANVQFDVAAALRLSYVRLDAAMQEVFRQLGVIVADFATELALAMIEPPADGDGEALLHALLRQNLLLYDPERARWRLHDLVRDLARHELKALGELEAASWRYARAALAITEQIQEHYQLGGDSALLALSRFDAERAHIDAARRWAHLQAETSAGDDLLINIALATRYIQDFRYDQRQEIIPLWEGVRMAARRLGDLLAEARALGFLGNAHYSLGELPTAITYHEQALTAFRGLGDRRGEGIALSNLGSAYKNLGEPSKAINCYEQHLAIASERGDQRGEGQALNALGGAYIDLNEPSKAISYYEQALAIFRELGDPHGEGITLGNLGLAYTELGDARRAIEACEGSRIIARALGDQRMQGYTLSYLSRAQVMQGNIARARNTYMQAGKLLQELDDRWGEAECQWQFGLALAVQGEGEEALPLLRAALAYQQEIGHAKLEERAVLVARLEAGEEFQPNFFSPVSQYVVGGDEKWTGTHDEGL